MAPKKKPSPVEKKPNPFAKYQKGGKKK